MKIFIFTQTLLTLTLLSTNGFVLKWRLTFGNKPHVHPHTDEERPIWLVNSYLNVIFIALCFDLLFPLFTSFLKKKDSFVFSVILRLLLLVLCVP